ncbi:hypothetical protein [Heyndrickxia coagulans]|uniref:hypothetical protein n=1 Tax=Heyndrickxia coagulans TaxID=1398 RepID=UPI0023E3F1DE|nr:hypothetical protein [Heyndrickxia coagulans]
MKKQKKILGWNISLILLILMLVGCSTNSHEQSKSTPSKEKSTSVANTTTEQKDSSNKDSDSTTNKSETGAYSSSGDNSNSKDSSSDKAEKEKPNKIGNDDLSNYSSQEIEYARVWLQLGPNQNIDELNVYRIPARTPLNSKDETSAKYPKGVTQLAGSRLVDGSVTYSSNGNGTINVYNVPLRWDGKYPAGEKLYNDIIKNTKLVRVDTGDSKKIIQLIKIMNIH